MKNVLILGLALLVVGCSGPSEDSDASKFIRVAQTARDTNNPEAAMNFYNKAKALDPTNPCIYLGLAQVYIDTKLLDAANSNLNQAAQFGADPSKVAYLRGKVYLLAGKLDEAEAEFSKYKTADCLNALGAIYDNRREHTKAQQCYKQVISMDPNYIDAYNNLGISYFMEKKYKDAVFYLENACSFHEATVNYRSNLALVYGIIGNLDKAREVYSKDFDGADLEEKIHRLQDIIASKSSKK